MSLPSGTSLFRWGRKDDLFIEKEVSKAIMTMCDKHFGGRVGEGGGVCVSSGLGRALQSGWLRCGLKEEAQLPPGGGSGGHRSWRVKGTGQGPDQRPVWFAEGR